MENKGFTLLEITVVIAIIALLSTIFLVNYRGGEKQFALQRSSHKLAQDIRTVEEMALSSRKYKETDFPKGGYGLYFTKNSNFYTLFADCDNGADYDTWGGAPRCADAQDDAGSSIREFMQEFSLEAGIEVSDTPPCSGETPLIITFYPPIPTLVFKCGQTLIEPGAARIILSSNGQTSQVSINAIGQIDID